MKNGKLSALLNTPLGVVVMVGAIVSGTELLFMAVLHEFLMVQFKFSEMVWDVIDAITITVVASPVLYFLVFRNIKDGEERLQQINAAALNAIVIVNEQGRITGWNRAARIMFQYSEEEAVGQQLHQLLAPPRYRDDAARGFARFEEAGSGPLINKTTEVSALRKDGSEFPIEISISAAKLKGRWHAIGVIRDITERKQAEQILRESEERYRTMIENSNDLIWVIAPDRKFTFANQQAAEAIGYAVDDWIGKTFEPLVLEEDLPMVLEIHGRAMRGEKVHYEVRGKKADGGILVLSVNASPILKDGKVVGTISFARDITERKHFEERTAALLKLSTSAETLDEKTLLQQGLDTVQHLTDSRIGFLHFVSEDQNEIELVTWSSDTLAHFCRAKFDRHYPVSTAGIWADCIHLKQPIIINDYATAPGRKGYPEGHADVQRFISAPILDGNLVRMIVGVGNAAKDYDEHDVETVRLFGYDLYRIIQRKRIEQALHNERDFAQSIIATAQAIILLLDTEGRIVSFNSYLENLSGWRLEEVRGKDWFSTFLPERNREATRKLFQAAIGGIQTRGNVDTLLTRDGRELQIEWYDTLLKDSEGKVTTLLAVGQDITERKQAGDELQKMLKAANESRQSMLGVIEDQKRAEEMLRHLNTELENKVLARTAALDKARLEAEQANQAKSSFLAAMSHEIRTPMNGVIGMVDVLHQSSLNGYQVEMVDLIRESAYSLLGIINDILDFSKIEAGKLEIEHAPTRVADVVEHVCGMLDTMAVKKGVELTLFTDPAIPTEVLGDTVRLRQVLVNIVNNAIKFSGKQQGRVSVRALLIKTVRGEPDATTSHPTRLSEDASQVVGYVEPHNPSTSSGRTAGENLEQVTLEFRITDNGIGMDKETLAGMFLPFTQADISTTRRFGGTGLGLSIAHRLVELMGGKITVQSEPGKGSTFAVQLPFKLLPAIPATSAAESPVTGLSCLVVGGTESLASDFAAYLTHDGAVVERAPNLAAAGELAGTLPPSMRVWVIDADGEPPPPDELRAVARFPLPMPSPQSSPASGRGSERERQLLIPAVVIGRGQRRKPRVQDAGLVSVDGNVLTRGILLKAVAIAAGRVSVEQETPQVGKGEAEFRPPSRDDALRQGRLILVAEDNETNQKVILRQLALLRFAADIAENGRIALERWQSGNYALLLADLHMPEMDGYELTAAIRAAEQGSRHLPIVALTANALKGEADHCRAIGMDDYLSKPVQLADLKTTLEKWLPAAVEKVVGATSRSRGDNGNRVWERPPGRDSAHRDQEVAHTPVPVDVNVLKKLVGDDEEIIRDFLHDFRLSAEKIAAELRTACAAGQAAAAGALAHKLKSSARSVGALALGELCAEMEQAGKAGDMATLAALLPRFEQELASVEGFLERY